MTDEAAERWAALAARLPGLLSQLCEAEPIRRDVPGSVPAKPGVYLFTEADRHVYVGQTRNLRRRLTQHAGKWARQNQATFAFGRARLEAMDHPALNGLRTRDELAGHPDFEVLFAQARAAVGRMEARYVEVDDPELRTVFEVYASVMLGTRTPSRRTSAIELELQFSAVDPIEGSSSSSAQRREVAGRPRRHSE